MMKGFDMQENHKDVQIMASRIAFWDSETKVQPLAVKRGLAWAISERLCSRVKRSKVADELIKKHGYPKGEAYDRVMCLTCDKGSDFEKLFPSDADIDAMAYRFGYQKGLSNTNGAGRKAKRDYDIHGNGVHITHRERMIVSKAYTRIVHKHDSQKAKKIWVDGGLTADRLQRNKLKEKAKQRIAKSCKTEHEAAEMYAKLAQSNRDEHGLRLGKIIAKLKGIRFNK